jgi:hypothetical protein
MHKLIGSVLSGSETLDKPVDVERRLGGVHTG